MKPPEKTVEEIADELCDGSERLYKSILKALQTERQRCEELAEKAEAKAFLRFSLILPFVSDGDKTEYARGVRDTVNNLKIDLKALASINNPK